MLRWGLRPRPPRLSATNVLRWTVDASRARRHTQQLRCARQGRRRGEGGQAHRPRAVREALTGGPRTHPPCSRPGVTLTCWLSTMGPASHEALCVHRCCRTHQLHPQRLLTQAWHLQRAQPWGRGPHGAAPGPGVGVGDSLCGRVEVGDGHTVIEGERRFGDHDCAKPELHAHGNVVCKAGEGAGAEERGGCSAPLPASGDHRVELAPRMGKGAQGRGAQSPGRNTGT